MSAQPTHGDGLPRAGHLAAFFGAPPTVPRAPDPERLAAIQRIEAKPRQALEAQTEHLTLAPAPFPRSEATVAQSLKVQRAAIQRVQRLSPLILPVILFLIVPVARIAIKSCIT